EFIARASVGNTYSPVRPSESTFSRSPARFAGLLLLVAAAAFAQEPSGTNSIPGVPPSGLPGRDPERVHDPSTVVIVDGVRRCFCTGPGVSLVREDASGHWRREASLFAEGKLPAWHNETVPGNRGFLWAPDVI